MAIRKIPTDLARVLLFETYLNEELEVNGEVWSVVSNEQISSGRWESYHDLVVKVYSKDSPLDIHYYKIEYSKGLTEQQYTRPFEHDGEFVEGREVEPYTISVTKFRVKGNLEKPKSKVAKPKLVQSEDES